MSFDSIKEDVIEGYPCDCGGSITKSMDGVRWWCATCEFEKVIKNSSVEIKLPKKE